MKDKFSSFEEGFSATIRGISLFDYLESNGFGDKVVLFNGTNTDPKSTELFTIQWELI